MVSECVKAQYQTAFAFGVYHDLMVWESDIVHEKLLDKGLEILKQERIREAGGGGRLQGLHGDQPEGGGRELRSWPGLRTRSRCW